MRELNVNEIEQVNGGNPWAWMLLGYVGSRIVDKISWPEPRTPVTKGQMGRSFP